MTTMNAELLDALEAAGALIGLEGDVKLLDWKVTVGLRHPRALAAKEFLPYWH